MDAGSGSISLGLRLSPAKAGSDAPIVSRFSWMVLTPNSWALQPLWLLNCESTPTLSVGFNSLKSRTLAVRVKDAGAWDHAARAPRERKRQRTSRAETGEGIRFL